MGQAIAREFLWFLGILILALPLGLLFVWMFGLSNSGYVAQDDVDLVITIYILGYILSIIGVYILRIVAFAIKSLVAPPAEATP